jgi:hypothetical protein
MKAKFWEVIGSQSKVTSVMQKLLILVSALAVFLGCSSKPQPSQLSGKVTFKGQPVPAGYISFTPDVTKGGLGPTQVMQIKEGVYDSSKEGEPGINPGVYLLEIAGFDGKRIPMYGQGKQIFTPVKDTHTVPQGTSTKDIVIPDSAGQNVKIQPTADT